MVIGPGSRYISEDQVTIGELFMRLFRWVLLIALIPVAPFFAAQGISTVQAEDNDGVIGPFKIFGDGDGLLVPVEVKGKTYQFVVDTGCAMTVVDRCLLRGEKSKTMVVNGAVDRKELPIFPVPEMNFAKRGLKGLIPTVIGSDLSELRKVSGYDVYGILGMDFLAHWIVDLDFDRGELWLRKKMPRDSVGNPVSISFARDGLPQINAKIGGWGESTMLIDTGNSGYDSGLIESRDCNYLIQFGDAKPAGHAKVESFSGPSEVRLLQAKSLKLGEFTLPAPIFSEGRQSAIGLYFLSRFRAILDFPDKKMYLTPGKSFLAPDKRSLSGMPLWKLDGKVTVHSVEPNSAAEKAGIQAGDVIVKIDDQPTEKLRMQEIRLRFCEPNTSVRLTISRSGKEIETSLQLE